MNNGKTPNLDEMLKLLDSSKSKENLLNTMKAKLNDEQKMKLRNIMNDRNALNKLLRSDEANEILKRLNQKK